MILVSWAYKINCERHVCIDSEQRSLWCGGGNGNGLDSHKGKMGGRSAQSCQKRSKEEKAREQSVSDGRHLALGGI